MQRGVEKTTPKRTRVRGGFLLTLCWFVPVMAIAAATGFFLARNYFAPKYLKPGEMRGSRPKPIRILPPEEAVQTMRSEPSVVWDEDYPDPSAEENRHTSRRSRRRAPHTEQPATGTTVTSPAEEPGAPAGETPPPAEPGATTAPQPSTAPSTDNANTPAPDAGAFD